MVDTKHLDGKPIVFKLRDGGVPHYGKVCKVEADIGIWVDAPALLTAIQADEATASKMQQYSTPVLLVPFSSLSFLAAEKESV